MLQTLSEPSSFSIANSICSESVKYSAWPLDAAKVHGQRFWGHHNGLKTCKWRQKMMNYPIKPLAIQLEYTPTGMDEEKDTLFHSDVIPHEIDDWMNSFDNFHTKCLPPNVQFLKICAVEPFLCRWGEVPLLLQLNYPIAHYEQYEHTSPSAGNQRFLLWTKGGCMVMNGPLR